MKDLIKTHPSIHRSVPVEVVLLALSRRALSPKSQRVAQRESIPSKQPLHSKLTAICSLVQIRRDERETEASARSSEEAQVGLLTVLICCIAEEKRAGNQSSPSRLDASIRKADQTAAPR